MAMVSDEGIFVGESAERMSRAYDAASKLAGLKFDNAGDPVYWRADYRDSDGWLKAQMRENTAREVISTLVDHGIVADGDIRFKEEIGFIESGSKYTHNVSFYLASIDMEKLAVLAASRCVYPVATTQAVRINAPLKLKM